MKTISASHQGELNLGTLKINCYILEDGTRVFEEAMDKLWSERKKKKSKHKKKRKLNKKKKHQKKKKKGKTDSKAKDNLHLFN